MADIPHIVLDEPFRVMKAMEPEYECFCRKLRSTTQELRGVKFSLENLKAPLPRRRKIRRER